MKQALGALGGLGTMSGMTITAAVDGSSLGNPGPAGWAWVVDDDHWDAGGWPEGTNNLGELTAVLELLKATEAAGLGAEKLRILADSQYAINVVTKWRHGWKKRGWAKTDKKPIKNLELIQEIDRVIEGRDVEFEWVKGHAGHAMNERADDLARGCAEAYQAGRTPAPGPAFGASSSVSSFSRSELIWSQLSTWTMSSSGSHRPPSSGLLRTMTLRLMRNTALEAESRAGKSSLTSREASAQSMR